MEINTEGERLELIDVLEALKQQGFVVEKETGKYQIKESNNFISSKMSLTEDATKYAFEYKKFIYWQQDVLPFVKDDGRLMSKEEQLDFWKQQHEGRK
jgi:hypothetical protein